MNRRLAARRLAALLVPLAVGACADAPTATTTRSAPDAAVLARADGLPPAGARGLTVMTRNLYLGGDIFAVARPGTPAAEIPLRVARLWQDIVASNFPERAGAIAGEIEQAAPHLIGLQEVPIYRIDPVSDAIAGGTRPATMVALDFLATLQDSLAARGLCYNVAASVQLTDVELPMVVSTSPLRFSDIRYTDRDVILARCDVPTSDPRSGVYTARLTVSVGGVTVTVLRGWTSVLATVGGVTYRFANTHLETQAAPPIQIAQARQLIAILAGETRPVVLVGDFNTDALGSDTPTYGILLGEGGFVDAWSEAHPRDPGYTSSLPASLFGPPELDTRIDLVLVRYPFHAPGNGGLVGGVHAEVIGEELDDRTASGRWPSDHAGVVVTLHAPKAIGKEPKEPKEQKVKKNK